ncbi:MAG: RNA polymerase sigma factor, partial [Cellulosilyticaceae bacterium]
FKRVTTGVNLETVSEEVVDSTIIEEEQQKQLLLEIAGLSYKYKEVILLYYYEEISTREIAQVLNIKEGSVRVRLQRAREKLSIKLKEVNHHEESL